MTSVPKPLKFLRPHYATLKAYYDAMADSDLKVWIFWRAFSLIISITETYLFHIFLLMQKFLADILSVLAMTMSAEGERVCWVTFVDLCFICSFLKSLCCQINSFVLVNFLAMQFSCLCNQCVFMYLSWLHNLYNMVTRNWIEVLLTIFYHGMVYLIFLSPCRLFQESLKYRLLGSEGDIGSWGHEYVRWVASDVY